MSRMNGKYVALPLLLELGFLYYTGRDSRKLSADQIMTKMNLSFTLQAFSKTVAYKSKDRK